MFKLKEKMARFGSKASAKIIKHSPEILFGVGVVTFVGTVYLAVKATPKIEKVLAEHNENLEVARQAAADPETEGYDEADLKHDTICYYRDTFFRVVKIAALPVACGLVSLGCFGGAQFIVIRRLGRMSAEYVLLQNTFDKYRENVRKDVGIEKDNDYYFSVHDEVIKAPVLDEDGNVEEKEETVKCGEITGMGYIWSEDSSPLCQGIDSTDDLMLEAKAENLKRQFELTRKITEWDVLSANGFYIPEELKRRKDGWMWGKIWDDENDENNELIFKIAYGKVPDYKKASGYKTVREIVWVNKENLYNRI